MRDCVIVIAEDSDLLQAMHKALRESGDIVICLRDVETAVHLLGRAAYDLVVADIGTLKRADGRAQPSSNLSLLLHHARNAPVILGSYGPGRAEDVVNLADPEALLRCVRETLSAHRARPAAPLESPDAGDADTFIYAPVLIPDPRTSSANLPVSSRK